MNLFYIFLIFVLSLNFSCSTPRPEGKTEAEVLYREAKELQEDGRYLMALEKLNTVRSKHPYSYFATHAELATADVYFDQENFSEAAAAYIVFKDFHPKFNDLAYVTWRIGESFFKQLPSTYDRDLSSGKEAKKHFQTLLRDYPSSKYVEQANSRINEYDELLRNKEKYIADFYFKTDDFRSARFHYISITEDFKKSSLIGHSMIRVLEASAELKEKDSCKYYYHHYLSRVPGDLKEDYESAYESCKSL